MGAWACAMLILGSNLGIAMAIFHGVVLIVAYNFDDRLSFTVRVNNPLDHDGSESRYQTERGLNFVGRTVTTSFTYRF